MSLSDEWENWHQSLLFGLYDEPGRQSEREFGWDWPIYDSIDEVRSDADGGVTIRAWIRDDTQTGGDSLYAVKVYPSGYATRKNVNE